MICELIRNLGVLEVPVWCYEWMPVIGWLRTRMDIPARGGALVSGFDLLTMEGDSNANPGYSDIGPLFAIGYIKGLRQAVYSKGHASHAER